MFMFMLVLLCVIMTGAFMAYIIGKLGWKWALVILGCIFVLPTLLMIVPTALVLLMSSWPLIMLIVMIVVIMKAFRKGKENRKKSDE